MKGIAIGLAVALVTAGSATAAFVVTSKDIKNGTIQLVDISKRAKAGLRGRRGPRGFIGADGPQGPAGTPGAPGAQGPPGIQRLRLATDSVSVPPSSESGPVRAFCGTGQIAISGGFIFGGIIITSAPAGQFWLVTGFNDLSVPTTLYAYAYCSPNITIEGTGGSSAALARNAAASRTP